MGVCQSKTEVDNRRTGTGILDEIRIAAKEKAINKRGDLKQCGSSIGLDDFRQEETGFSSRVVHFETAPFGKPIEEVYDGVHNGVELGSGCSGVVRLVTHKATGVQYAVKCLDLGLVGTEEGLERLREEIRIMCQLDHPNIVRLEEVYETQSQIYLVQELCSGGDLFDRLDDQTFGYYTESGCAHLVYQMLSAVHYLHSKGIVHRDLKLENFLFSSKANDSELILIDFGLSKHFQLGEVHHDAVGTPYTVAPEVINGCHNEKCDVWGIGVIAFLLMSGTPPFGGCGGPSEPILPVRQRILSGSYHFDPDDGWSSVSHKAKDFITSLLVIHPEKRPTAYEALNHPWLQEQGHSHVKDAQLDPKVVKSLVAFKEYSDIHKLLCEVLSFTLLPHQITRLRKEFEKINTDGSGEISFSVLKQVLLDNASSGSLGALKEDDVKEIFNALRVEKSEKRIHYHEFIAAGLSQCQVDDRNLRLAFERLDGEHKGFVTLDDILILMGYDHKDDNATEAIQEAWTTTLEKAQCCYSSEASITYDGFRILMKGQASKSQAHGSPIQGKDLSAASGSSITDCSDSLINENTKEEVKTLACFGTDARRALALPESHDNTFGLDFVNADTTDILSSSAIATNRHLYRGHRQMRLFVLEATRRLEEDQARRAREAAIADPGLLSDVTLSTSGMCSLGMTSREQQSRDTGGEASASLDPMIQRYLERHKVEREFRIRRAAISGGRGHTLNVRKKTMSDAMWVAKSSPVAPSSVSSLSCNKNRDPSSRTKVLSL